MRKATQEHKNLVKSQNITLELNSLKSLLEVANINCQPAFEQDLGKSKGMLLTPAIKHLITKCMTENRIQVLTSISIEEILKGERISDFEDHASDFYFALDELHWALLEIFQISDFLGENQDITLEDSKSKSWIKETWESIDTRVKNSQSHIQKKYKLSLPHEKRYKGITNRIDNCKNLSHPSMDDLRTLKIEIKDLTNRLTQVSLQIVVAPFLQQD